MNKKSIKYRILTIFLCSIACVVAFKSMPQDVVAEELKIGIVDINEIFDKYDKRTDLDQELKETEAEFKKEIESKKKIMIDLNEETQLLDLGSETRNENMEILERKNVELEGYAKFAEQQLTKKYKDAFEKIYEEIVKEVDSFGKEKNYSVIIKKEKPNLQSNQLSDLQFKIGIRTVLYNSSEIDVTPNITERINARYQKEKNASAGK
ncbi:MAG: OmpH family outer membrane protein [Candidatus Scalindua sp.]|jgi:Skp family chaperone for outer membrane proteins|nr:OmpH family outer membrane protein [Candidatus Scalindua sp.]MBT5303487.1 OmpH family outer membrane protein [Candidatus Scalindua sp.]MBT6053004.1 OmpH family outer membrane protein [Candidatus Scalindua sp.]MBT6231032.1 OmpH family outer membrane protein [Candidatus Scalindua sp.]MBT6561627.1 OmpH family outer membrane protein [Candidatus Scalindua sp.]